MSHQHMEDTTLAQRILIGMLTMVIGIGCGDGASADMPGASPGVDEPFFDVCSQQPWPWVRSANNLQYDRITVLRDGIFSIVPYKNGVLSPADKWNGVVHLYSKNREYCEPILQTPADFSRADGSAAIYCADQSTEVHVSLVGIRVFVQIDCVTQNKIAKYKVTQDYEKSL